jgi:isopenicillin N synthase-like dioxygenase
MPASPERPLVSGDERRQERPTWLGRGARRMVTRMLGFATFPHLSGRTAAERWDLAAKHSRAVVDRRRMAGDCADRDEGRRGAVTGGIPIIDVADYLQGQPGALQQTARAVHDALTDVGFFVITGHAVPAELIGQTFDEARRLHDLPMTRKLALKLNEHNNGYMAMGRYAVWTSDVNNNDKPDLNEAFFIKRERDPDNALRRAGRRFAGPNIWPDEADLPGFRQHVMDYVNAMEALTNRLLPAVAVSLDLPSDYFLPHFVDGQFSLRLSHYPPVAAEANQFGIAPHTDANFMTFLPQSDVPGLQVRTTSGEWLDVPFIPGSFAVNAGDTMRRWTNGRFLSTPHRALPPVGQHRYALPFFLAPHLDTTIECLSTCTQLGNPPRWEPISYENWITAWTDANYDPKRQQDVAA